MLHDKGLFQYEDPIAKHWPEFAQHGKENITIADLMRHEAGMPKHGTEGVHCDNYSTENIKKNTIGKMIEDTKPFWASFGKREYHGSNRDTIGNEIFRRIEPEGRTMAEYMRAELCPCIDGAILMGATDEELANYIECESYGGWKMFKDLWNGPYKAPVNMKLGDAGAWGEEMMADFKKRDAEMKAAGGYPEYLDQAREDEEIYDTKGNKKFMFSKMMSKFEIPSANMSSNARSLAKLSAFMAQKGSLNGKSLMSEDTWNAMHEEPTKGRLSFQALTYFTKGGLNAYGAGP
jgi:CubicO group peptidase (beta-lactamase class C family)